MPNLEWVVINDGSSDDTACVIKKMQDSCGGKIVYKQQPNRGRYAALNEAVFLMTGSYALIMDSDDWFSPSAFTRFAEQINWLDLNRQIAGSVGLCTDYEKRLLGRPFPNDKMIATFQEITDQHGVYGDKKEIIRASVLREVFPFPVFQDEKRFAMSLMWRRIGRKYKCRFINEPWVIKEYRPDGLTANLTRVKARSARASAYYYAELLSEEPQAALWLRLRWAVNFNRYYTHAKLKRGATRSMIQVLVIFTFPVGMALAFYDRISMWYLARNCYK